MTVSAGLDSQLVTGRYLFKHSPQDGLDKVLAAYGEKERIVYLLFYKQAYQHCILLSTGFSSVNRYALFASVVSQLLATA